MVMTHERYWRISQGWDNLTEQEMYDGWHFCPDWDYMLIGPGMPEMEACLCQKKLFKED